MRTTSRPCGIPCRPLIPEPDRSWLALAAYNQGIGHLEDAWVLAQRLGLNADTWVHVRQTLPLLADAEHYSTLKHGYARGGEALVLTETGVGVLPGAHRAGTGLDPAAR